MIFVSVIVASTTLILTAWLVLHASRSDRLDEAEAELRRAQDTLQRLLEKQERDQK